MFFNHISKVSRDITFRSLGFMLGRGSGVSGYSQQRGFDLAIPICLPDGFLSAVFVQVRIMKMICTLLKSTNLKPRWTVGLHA